MNRYIINLKLNQELRRCFGDKTYMYVYITEKQQRNIAEFFERAEKLKELDIIKKFNIVKNAEKTSDSNYDIALIFDFNTVEMLNEYQKLPQHLEFGEFVYSVRVDKACDYEF